MVPFYMWRTLCSTVFKAETSNRCAVLGPLQEQTLAMAQVGLLRRNAAVYAFHFWVQTIKILRADTTATWLPSGSKGVLSVEFLWDTLNHTRVKPLTSCGIVPCKAKRYQQLQYNLAQTYSNAPKKNEKGSAMDDHLSSMIVSYSFGLIKRSCRKFRVFGAPLPLVWKGTRCYCNKSFALQKHARALFVCLLARLRVRLLAYLLIEMCIRLLSLCMSW